MYHYAPIAEGETVRVALYKTREYHSTQIAEGEQVLSWAPNHKVFLLGELAIWYQSQKEEGANGPTMDT